MVCGNDHIQLQMALLWFFHEAVTKHIQVEQANSTQVVDPSSMFAHVRRSYKENMLLMIHVSHGIITRFVCQPTALFYSIEAFLPYVCIRQHAIEKTNSNKCFLSFPILLYGPKMSSWKYK